PSHGVAKEAVIFNDRNQLLFHHAASGSSPEPAVRAAQECRRFAWDHLIWVNSAISATLVPHKLWLMGEENCRSAPKKAVELCQYAFGKNGRRVLSGQCSDCSNPSPGGRAARPPGSNSGASVKGVVRGQGDCLFEESKILVEQFLGFRAGH